MRFLGLPAFNKVLEVVAPFNLWLVAVRRLILELRQRLPNNVLDNINETRPRLHLRAVCREGESVLRDLQECHAQGPDVGVDRVRLAGDALWCHVE